MDINKKLFTICKAANKNGQVGMLVHLFVWCLQHSSRSKHAAVQSALNDIEKTVIPLTKAKYTLPENQITMNQDWGKGYEQVITYAYDNWFSKQNEQSKGEGIADNLLIWLLDGGFVKDQSANPCREICVQHGVSSQLFKRIEKGNISFIQELGFGTEINEQWIQQTLEKEIIERNEDFERHLGFLSLAVRQKKHYLLKGYSGVGKSTFICGLICRALKRWQKSQNEVLRESRFALFSPRDFTGSFDSVLNNFRELDRYLQENKHIIPVFDGFDHLLEKSLRINQHFSEIFGSILFSGGCTWVMVCHTEMVDKTDLLKNITAYPLAPMTEKDTIRLVRYSLTKQMDETLTLAEPLDRFCNMLMNLASEHYPEKLFPQSALYLVEGTVNRAINRSQELKKEPVGQLAIKDLRSFVAEDRGINPETLDKDPRTFYEGIAGKIKKENVVGQDHAVDNICWMLATQAELPPQRTPRGRFLLVGPPGVGKTELARSLAYHMGYGDEGFFRFNMSEYGSEGARTRFIGADPGYVGFKGTRTIYDMVRSRPSCVILLDEIDRADSSIQDLLLSMLEGEGNNALNEKVYFSQAIFLMTTNLGQELVWEAYKKTDKPAQNTLKVKEALANRNEMAKKYPDKHFRNNMIKGLSSQMEAQVIDFLEKELSKFGDVKSLTDAGRYLDIKRLLTDSRQQKSSFDRAFLDRIDFIIPFYPIKEPPLLLYIMNLKLKNTGWENCPESLQTRMLREALGEEESIRPIERIIRKYQSDWVRLERQLENALEHVTDEEKREILIKIFEQNDPEEALEELIREIKQTEYDKNPEEGQNVK
ncbi:MAG: ATP-dependent Clp protease ATP-binding subunit [Desulfamplus sp.]|nr:ATP-dependent Clp protease ATP-binding subunit [Desulfamplus sp.]